MDLIAREDLGARFAAAVTCRPQPDDPAPPAVGGRATRALAPMLDRRRSVRAYATTPLTEVLLAGVVEAGLTADRELWASDDDLQAVVLAARVLPLAPGVYEYGSRLAWRAPMPALADHVFQPDLATAAAVVVVCGDLDLAVARHGPHGYRRLLTRAGAAVAACQLAAQRAGLHACPFDGLLPEGANPVRDLSLFALALGHPAPDAAPDPAPRRD